MKALTLARNQFYLGAFQAVTTSHLTTQRQQQHQTGQKVGSDEEIQLIQIYHYRAQLALGNYAQVSNELKASANNNIPAEIAGILKLQCEIYQLNSSNATQQQQLQQRLLQFQHNHADTVENNDLVAALLAEAFISQQMWQQAIEVLSGHVDDLECLSLAVSIMLQLNRPDLASRQLVSRMKQLDENAVLTQLAESWIFCTYSSTNNQQDSSTGAGMAKFQDAFYIIQELLETYGSTSKLLSSQAACQLAMGKYEDAERLLSDALAKTPRDPDSLANLATCQLLLKQSAAATATLEQLQQVAPNHHLVKDYTSKLEQFHAGAQQFSPTRAT